MKGSFGSVDGRVVVVSTADVVVVEGVRMSVAVVTVGADVVNSPQAIIDRNRIDNRVKDSSFFMNFLR